MGSGFGSNLELPPVKGTEIHTPTRFQFIASPESMIPSMVHILGTAMPQVSFPVFDGSNLRLWKKWCETFFAFLFYP